jgi:hypothetical protein
MQQMPVNKGRNGFPVIVFPLLPETLPEKRRKNVHSMPVNKGFPASGNCFQHRIPVFRPPFRADTGIAETGTYTPLKPNVTGTNTA